MVVLMDTCYCSPTCNSLLIQKALNNTTSTRWQHSSQSCMEWLSLVKLRSSDTASWTLLIDALASLILTRGSIFRTQCCQANWGVWLMLLRRDLGRTVDCSKAETVLISEESVQQWRRSRADPLVLQKVHESRQTTPLITEIQLLITTRHSLAPDVFALWTSHLFFCSLAWAPLWWSKHAGKWIISGASNRRINSIGKDGTLDVFLFYFSLCYPSPQWLPVSTCRTI